MIKKIIKFIFSKPIKFIKENRCYKRKVKKGFVEPGKSCNGVVGGDRYSCYLNYDCIDCKHYNK